MTDPVQNPPEGSQPPLDLDVTTADDTDDVLDHDEDPELHIGEELLDPWQDATALDWPNDDNDEEDDQ